MGKPEEGKLHHHGCYTGCASQSVGSSPTTEFKGLDRPRWTLLPSATILNAPNFILLNNMGFGDNPVYNNWENIVTTYFLCFYHPKDESEEKYYARAFKYVLCTIVYTINGWNEKHWCLYASIMSHLHALWWPDLVWINLPYGY